ncbi:uncharacterized protein BP5553_02767 [Venustampulla echinocandica]|uniref:Uncharacterized protein n=1 Tax=Venustampulla echinocandica TaxID=2656787 RepID=A0A370TSC0_9HELO|nr:uncharacterized protein BP5553_02767 [Venustampulla echinocandica]RDL38427.1 hypothetical protein BP5553_02767 [Venustampulla echinocandica]
MKRFTGRRRRTSPQEANEPTSPQAHKKSTSPRQVNVPTRSPQAQRSQHVLRHRTITARSQAHPSSWGHCVLSIFGYEYRLTHTRTYMPPSPALQAEALPSDHYSLRFEIPSDKGWESGSIGPLQPEGELLPVRVRDWTSISPVHGLPTIWPYHNYA